MHRLQAQEMEAYLRLLGIWKWRQATYLVRKKRLDFECY
jgi:hypothetical protein